VELCTEMSELASDVRMSLTGRSFGVSGRFVGWFELYGLEGLRHHNCVRRNRRTCIFTLRNPVACAFLMGKA
jgi:hypothetical protein